MPDIWVGVADPGVGAGRLRTAKQVVLDASGNGQLQIPVAGSQRWWVWRMTIRCPIDADATPPACFVYDGPADPLYLLDETYDGSQNTSDFGSPYVFDDGDFLTFQWVGGPPGGTATARLIGTFEIRR